MRIRQFPEKNAFISLTEKCNVVPVCVEILADMETPVSLLSKFYKKKNPIFLLESVEGGERWGRYSFMGASAKSRVRVFADDVEIIEGKTSKRIPHGNRPFDILESFMAEFHPAVVTELPRFWGGLVGYLTYEMISFIEDIPNSWPKEKPLANFVIPDEILIFDNVKHTLICVVISFLENGNDPSDAYDEAQSRIESMLREINTNAAEYPIENTSFAPALSPTRDAAHFQSLVRTVKDHIRAGDIIQAVISQPFVCDTPPDLHALYRAQRFINPSPYLFYMHLDDMALVGSSPETMVRLENGVATVRPIAGTRHRGKNEQEDRALAGELLSDEKERAEHLMLVDLGRNDLGRVAVTGTVQVTDLMFVERYSHVMHLVSNITCDLKKDCNAWDLFAATFPAGTLSGAPKIRAMEIISDLESEPRGPYGGAVGYVSFSGNMDMAITIRTACIEDNRLTVRAGAGIVADSDPEKEHQETVNKAMAIERALALVNR